MAGIGDRHKIQLKKYVPVKGADGTISKTVTKYNVWANVRRLSDSRNYVSGQSRMSESYEFIVNYRGSFDLSADWQVLYLGNSYTVSSIERDGENRFDWIIKATHIGKGHG